MNLIFSSMGQVCFHGIGESSSPVHKTCYPCARTILLPMYPVCTLPSPLPRGERGHRGECACVAHILRGKDAPVPFPAAMFPLSPCGRGPGRGGAMRYSSPMSPIELLSAHNRQTVPIEHVIADPP